MKAVIVGSLALVVMCCSCSRQDTAKIPGPWKLHNVELMEMAPAGGGQMALTLFSANKKPRYLWMTLSFDQEPSRSDLERFTILEPDGGTVNGASVHSSLAKGSDLILIFESQTGWYTSTRLALSGMDHKVPFKTPRTVSK